MDSGSKNLTINLNNGGKLSRKHMGLFVRSQSQNLQNKVILGFIFDLIRDWPATTILSPLQRSRPGRNYAATTGCTKPVSRFKSFKLTTHLRPMTLKKYSVTLRSVSRVLLDRIQFRKVIRVP
uniref:Uncharacterized protein n=1 Tax=Solanum tuberosum TaxID=4113 RepID=M1DE78_SOLTU